MVRAIHARAPRARILVGDYPALFAANPAGCSVFSAGNIAWLDAQVPKLDAVIRAGVAASGVGRAHTVDVQKAFRGHALCGPGPAWLNGLVTGPFGAPLPQSFHPNLAGTVAYATAFAARLH